MPVTVEQCRNDDDGGGGGDLQAVERDDYQDDCTVSAPGFSERVDRLTSCLLLHVI